MDNRHAEQMAEQYWRWYHERTEDLEKAADQRTKEIIHAVQAAAKLQADATQRAHQELATAIRDLTETLRRLR